MGRVPAALLSILAALLVASPARADASFGVADDHGKYAEAGNSGYFTALRGAGLTSNRVTVQWDADRPTTIVDRAFLDRSLPLALVRGVHVVFAVYPSRPDGLTANPNGPAQFAEFVRQLALRYPQVKDYVIGNEPNQPRFWRPQFAPDGAPVSAATMLPVLAASYDALKSVDPSMRVAGLGLSERGNDNPSAPSNISTSPVRFLRDLGAAYRASGRAAPLMDELDFHPYPESPADPLLKAYAWPSVGMANVDRLKQAVWDAFNGTAQPTTETGLTLRIGEVGWQVGIVPASAGAYHGTESVPVTDEARQGTIYGELVRHVVCDPDITAAYFFGLVDEPDLDRFQAGLYRADGSARPAHDAVRNAIAETGGRCAGAPRTWRHTTSVVGAGATFGDLSRVRSWKQKAWGFNVTAAEEASFKAAIVPVAGTSATGAEISRALQGKRLAAVRADGTIRAGWTPRVTFPKLRLAPGRYVYAAQLAAAMNPARTSTFVSKPFSVGAPLKK
jgi:hypothetical protein